jgi:hypothetical protein
MRLFSWAIAIFLALVLVTELMPGAGFLNQTLGAGELVFVAVGIPVVLAFPVVAKRWFQFLSDMGL